MGRKRRLTGLAFLTGFSGAMMPGPLLVVVIEQTAIQKSFKPVCGLILGHALLELGLIGLLVAGLRAALGRPRVRGAIGMAGGAALIWMGYDMIVHAFGLRLDLSGGAGAAAYSWGRLVFWGAAVSLANPYFTGWWATIGVGQLAQMAPRSAGEYLSFYLGHAGADYAWYLIVSAILVTGHAWLSNGVYQWLIFGCGLALVVLGLFFLWAGAGFVREGTKAG